MTYKKKCCQATTPLVAKGMKHTVYREETLK